MERRGIEVRFVAGRRVTTAAGLEVVRESFAAVNAALCLALWPSAIGFAGDEIGPRRGARTGARARRRRAAVVPRGPSRRRWPRVSCPSVSPLAAGR